MNTWITSDTHFGHENIIKYCNRPYPNVGAMNEDLVRRWNNRVAPGDLVYHLGDVGYMKGSQKVLTEDNAMNQLIRRLNGKKILILGNHDKSAERMMEFGFDFACEEMVIGHYGRQLLLVHRPQLTQRSDIDFTLHGHIHNSTPEEREPHKAKGELVYIPTFNINLSVEVTNYEPQSLNAVVKKKIFQDKHRAKDS